VLFLYLLLPVMTESHARRNYVRRFGAAFFLVSARARLESGFGERSEKFALNVSRGQNKQRKGASEQDARRAG